MFQGNGQGDIAPQLFAMYSSWSLDIRKENFWKEDDLVATLRVKDECRLFKNIPFKVRLLYMEPCSVVDKMRRNISRYGLALN